MVIVILDRWRDEKTVVAYLARSVVELEAEEGGGEGGDEGQEDGHGQATDRPASGEQNQQDHSRLLHRNATS
jgi:hypothetical protein